MHQPPETQSENAITEARPPGRSNHLQPNQGTTVEEKPLKDRRRLLKIKLCSLMAEAKIIRREENRTRHRQLHHELWHHRTHEVRFEARRTHVAYGYLRGLPYGRIEQKRSEDNELTDYDWKGIAVMIKKYGPTPFNEPALEAWKKT